MSSNYWLVEILKEQQDRKQTELLFRIYVYDGSYGVVMIPMVSIFTSSPLLQVMISHLGNVQMSPEQKKQTG